MPRVHRMFSVARVGSFFLSLAAIVCVGTSVASASQAVITGDASVSSARTTTNYGALANLYVGNGNTSLIQYSLATLPAGVTASQITKATITLFVNRVNTSGAIAVAPITSAWTEGAVTYATVPSIGATTTTFTPTTAGTYGESLATTGNVVGSIENAGVCSASSSTVTAYQLQTVAASAFSSATGNPAAIPAPLVLP